MITRWCRCWICRRFCRGWFCGNPVPLQAKRMSCLAPLLVCVFPCRCEPFCQVFFRYKGAWVTCSFCPPNHRTAVCIQKKCPRTNCLQSRDFFVNRCFPFCSHFVTCSRIGDAFGREGLKKQSLGVTLARLVTQGEFGYTRML